MSQSQAAVLLDLTRNDYGMMERDEMTYPFEVPIISDPKPHEICLLRRREMELTIPECAAMIGCSRYWYNKMELGEVDYSALIKFWG